jgi:hypothetical protein
MDRMSIKRLGSATSTRRAIDARAKAAPAILLFALLSVAVATAGPITLELKSGSTIKGELTKWDGEQATIRAEFGEFTLAKTQLSEKALSELAISSGDSSALKAKITELQSIVESLRRDNAALREQLAGAASRPAAPPVAPATMPAGAIGFAAAPAAAAPAGGGYWISSTGKRHNANCRYYQTSRGRPGAGNEGVGCKICGG